MPGRQKFRRGRGKRILRQAFGDLLPETIQRRPKMGFGVPLDHWFRHELKDYIREVLLDRRTLERGYFRRQPSANCSTNTSRGISVTAIGFGHS